MWTVDQLNSALRHVYTAVGAVGAFAVATHFLPQATVDQLVASVQAIGNGTSMVIGGVLALIPILSGISAAVSASLPHRAKALAATGHVHIFVAPDAPADLKAVAADPDVPAVTG